MDGTWRPGLRPLPGLHPQVRPADCTRHGYHLFMLRIDAAAFGAPATPVLEALEAEGIPCSRGYGYSLPRQPLFRNKAFGPVPGRSLRSARLRVAPAARRAT